MSAQKLITKHLDLWTGAITKKSTSGRGSNRKIELTGIKKLRELILGMAVQGKLTTREATDVPASNLLQRISAKQTQLHTQGKIKKRKKLPSVSVEEQSFHLPESWEWTRLGTLFDSIISGGTPSKQNPRFWDGDIPWASVKDLGKSKHLDKTQDYITEEGLKAGSKLADTGDVLICTRMGLGKVAICSKPVAINQDLKAVKISREVSLDYFFLAYKTLDITGTGTTVAGITQDKLLNYVIGLPPIDEQRRIVQKVDELMALCDRLEQQTNDQLEAHEILVDTLLGTLTQSENATELADNWARLSAHFDTLFTTEQSIDKLKQTILQLAVMGRLVEQDAGDETASELLDNIASERHELVQLGKIRTPKIPASTDLQISPPFHLPRNWSWARLVEFFAIVTDGDHQAPPKSEDGVPFLVIGNLNTGRIDFSGCKHVKKSYYSELDWSKKPTNGDLLYTVTGSYGIPIKVLTSRAFCVQRHVAILRAAASTPRDYIKLVLESEYGQSYADEIATGIAQKTVPLTGLRKMPIPLPPLAEQNRIVKKVDELMALCNQLKERLSHASETRCHLAEAVVKEAVA